MVMVFHFLGHHGEPARLIRASMIGQTGVDLFFVLSGFLITRILLSAKESPHFFRSFYARRTLRIFPLYFGFLAIYFFLVRPLFGEPIPSFASQRWSWFYLQNLPATFSSLQSSGPDHFWSLAVEEHFYVIWPLMVFILSRRNFALLVVATLLFPPVLRSIFLSHGINVLYFTFTRADALGYGALLAVALTGKSWSAIRRIHFFRWLSIALAVLLLPAFVFLSGNGFQWLQVIKGSLIPAFYVAVIGFCLSDLRAWPLTKIFSIRWLRWLGAISYGLYVFHPTCFGLVQRFVRPSSFVLDLTLSFGFTILVSYLSFRFFESPILRLKNRFGYEMKRAQNIAQPGRDRLISPLHDLGA